jgi:DNA replication and repair protein RecF
VIIKSIKAIYFRSHERVESSLHPRCHLFVGENGVGKTNLLDLIHYLATGRSYFAGFDKDVVKKGKDFMRLQAEVEGEDGTSNVVIKWQKVGGKVVEWDGIPLEKLTDHLGRMKVVMMAPQDAFVLQTGNQEKRKWMDRVLCQKDRKYTLSLGRYNQILQRRNAYLKNTPEHLLDDMLLRTYWEEMKEPALYIHRCRRSFCVEALNRLTSSYKRVAQADEEVSVKYRSSLNDQEWDQILDMDSDRRNRSTTFGIHKDELDFLINGQKLKYYGSQGQTKTFFIALKMAELETLKGEGGAILLIDDVYSKLDQGRMSGLMDVLKGLVDVQVVMTDTHEQRMTDLLREAEIPSQVTLLEHGKLILRYAQEEE